MVKNHGNRNRLRGRAQQGKAGFLIKSNEEPTCPACGSRLKKKDWVSRICRDIGGEADWLLIERRQCTNKDCNKTHRLLPGDKVLPYKHYEAGIIEDVIDGTLNEEALSEEQHPSDSTIQRWRKWAEEFLRNIEGQLRSLVYRVYELSYEFLKSEEPLLEELRERIGYGWLTAVVRIYIDTGGI